MSDIDEPKIKACFADNADLPMACGIDIDEGYNCYYALQGGIKEECPHWKPAKTRDICKDILAIRLRIGEQFDFKANVEDKKDKATDADTQGLRKRIGAAIFHNEERG